MVKRLLGFLIQFYVRFVAMLFVPTLVIYFILLFMLLAESFFLVSNDLVPGTPIIAHDVVSKVHSEVTQILDDGQRLYVFYENRGIIQVYDLEGNYQYAITIDVAHNGESEIATQDEKLYAKDRNGNMYIFQGDVLEEYIENNDSTQQRIRSISKQVGMYQDGFFKREQSENYKVRFGSIWRTAEGEKAHCVVKRPLWFAVFQIDFLKVGFGFLAFIVMPILLYGRKN